jgi:hypothetical protein
VPSRAAGNALVCRLTEVKISLNEESLDIHSQSPVEVHDRSAEVPHAILLKLLVDGK